MDRALKLTSDKCIYEYCGLTVEDHIFFGTAIRANAETVEKWLEEVKDIKSYS